MPVCRKYAGYQPRAGLVLGALEQTWPSRHTGNTASIRDMILTCTPDTQEPDTIPNHNRHTDTRHRTAADTIPEETALDTQKLDTIELPYQNRHKTPYQNRIDTRHKTTYNTRTQTRQPN